ncbi:MAG: outer membrane beta-barrel protein [Gallionella sp.]|nr:outer membrane beta-barrel protein [Gallionella sp.]MDD4946750.1 outer membrane beta-barrel protein [Gallionella sp.]
MLHKYSAISVAVIGVLFSLSSSAVEFEPAQTNAGGFEITPSARLSIGRDSNVGLTNAAQTATNFTMLEPSVEVALPTHGQLYGAKYLGRLVRYSGGTTDNYNDHSFNVFADNVWSSRFKTLVDVNYLKGHDGRNALLFKNKELFHATGFNVMGHYGAEGAQGQFELSAGQVSKRYDTNNSGATQLYDNNRTDLIGTFFYRVAPATQMFVEARNSKFSYVVALPGKNLDSTEQGYMLGVKWDATAKTTGNIKLGSMKKSFNLGQLPSGSTAVWDVGIQWLPKTYSKVDFKLQQRANEYGGVGSFIISNDSSLAWAHDWTSYVTSTLSVGDGSDKFQASTRTDKRQTYGARLTYGFRSWLRVGVEYQHSRRTSTVPAVAYTKAVTMLTLEGSL